jgi:hypothetical protein
MIGTKVTEFNLLLSCPNDLSEFKEEVSDCVECFNNLYGTASNVVVSVKHWKNASYPDSSKSTQEGINEQVVDHCSFGMALFGSRFGTPTERYGSGTEEEISLLLGQGKQVFIYFLVGEDYQPDQASDPEQAAKVLAFKKNLRAYRDVKNKEEFHRYFSIDLTAYMLKQAEVEITSPFAKRQSELGIYGIPASQGRGVLIQRRSYENSRLLVERANEILAIIHKIQASPLKPRETPVPQKTVGPYGIEMSVLQQVQSTLSLYENLDVSEGIKAPIRAFAQVNGIALDDTVFWNVGNLKKNTYSAGLLGLGYQGSPEECARYEDILDLSEKIEQLKEFRSYFALFSNQPFLSLFILNDGTCSDSDIDVTLKLPQGSFLDISSFAYPEEGIIEEVVDRKFPTLFFSQSLTHDFSSYPDYPPFSNVPAIPEPILGMASDPNSIYDDQKRRYRNLIHCLRGYQVFDEADGVYLRFHFSEIKQHVNVLFPCFIFLSAIPESLTYTITSKGSPDEIHGALTIADSLPRL